MPANMPTTKSVTITTSATQIVAADLTRGALVISVPSGSTVYIGGSDVTTSTGVPATTSFTLTPGYTAMYGIVTSGTVAVNVMEIH